MTFKLDENLPLDLITDIGNFGHDADTVIAEGLRGAPDTAVMAAASAAGRILLTLDKGIANVRSFPATTTAGVVLFRPDRLGRRAVLAFVRERLSKLLELELSGRITVVGPARIRLR